jgi:hypothetical protein
MRCHRAVLLGRRTTLTRRCPLAPPPCHAPAHLVTCCKYAQCMQVRLETIQRCARTWSPSAMQRAQLAHADAAPHPPPIAYQPVRACLSCMHDELSLALKREARTAEFFSERFELAARLRRRGATPQSQIASATTATTATAAMAATITGHLGPSSPRCMLRPVVGSGGSSVIACSASW